MSIWDKLKEFLDTENNKQTVSYDTSRFAFVDVETGVNDNKIHDIGALRHDGAVFHSASKKDFTKFINNVDFLCGHNIIHHDAKYLFGESRCRQRLVDTLYMSPPLP